MISEEIAFELRLMENEDNWPRWPLLPVKNRIRMRDQDGGAPMFGVIYAGNPHTVFVDVNIWTGDLAKTLDNAKKERFSSWEKLIEAGWKGD